MNRRPRVASRSSPINSSSLFIVSLIVHLRLYHVLYGDGDVREEVEAGQRLDLVNAHAVLLPRVVPYPLRVGHDDGDDARRGRDARNVVARSGGQNHYDFPS